VAGNNGDTYYEPNGTCTTPVPPHTHTGYDQGLNGTGAAWYNSTSSGPAPEGAPALHTLVAGGSFDLTSGSPGTGVTSSFITAVFTGWLTVPTGGDFFWAQGLPGNGAVSVTANGQALATDAVTSCSTGNLATAMGGNLNAGTYQISIEYWYDAYEADGYYPQLSLDFGSLSVCGSGTGRSGDEEATGLSAVPASDLDPGYNYTTSTQADNAGTGTSNALTNYVYGDPAHGLQTQKVVDPSGQDLVTNYSYEGSSGFYDLSATKLPAGNSTTDTYYNGTDTGVTATNPCPGGASGISQGDGLYQQVTPARTQTYVYNSAGQILATRLSSSDGWTCASYDARGRATSVSYPAFDGAPAYTDTNNYAVGNDPLVTSVTKAVSGGPTTTLTTTVNLLGQTVSYTDANGNTTTTSYDQVGRVTSTGGSFGTVVTTYDSDGQVQNNSYNGTTEDTPAYDANDDLTGDTYGNGTSLSYGYDTGGRLYSEAFDQAGGSALFSDTEGLSQAGDVLTDTEDGPGGGSVGSDTYAYDSAGRLSTADGEGQDLSYTYSPSGGCGALTGAGANSDRTEESDEAIATGVTTTTSYCYGNDDQVQSYTAQVGSGTPTTTNAAYDSDGNTITLGDQTFTYDAQDYVASETTTVGSTTTVVTYELDAMERVTQREVKVNGTLTEDDLYGYAGSGSSAAAVTNELASGGGAASISAVGSLAKGTGTTLSVSPQTVGDLMVLTVSTGSNPAPTVSTVSGGGVGTWTLAKRIDDNTYAFEDAEIWTGVVTATGASTITITLSGYSDGNDLTAQEFSAGSGATWSVASSAAATQFNTPFDYPSLTAASAGQLYYGVAIRNNSGTLAGGGTTGFTYNATGLGLSDLVTYDTNVSGAVEPTATNSSSGSYENVVGVLISATGGSSASTTYMVGLTGGILLEVTGSTQSWYYPNLEGSMAAEASSSGTAVGGVTLYDPFGNPLTSLQSDSPDGLAYGFEGKHGIGTDNDAGGLVLMGARLYSPAMGRFLQVDSVFGGSCNAYDYTCQDPLNGSDLAGKYYTKKSGKYTLTCSSLNQECWFGTPTQVCKSVGSQSFDGQMILGCPSQYNSSQNDVSKAFRWVAQTFTLKHIAVGVFGTGVGTLAAGAEFGMIGFLGWDEVAAGIFIAGGLMALLSVPLLIVAFWPAQSVD
jgi:RHS repeat-associated protein